MRVVSTPEAASFIQGNGGQLFVWTTVHRSFRLTLTLLEASTDPPEDALSFRPVDAGDFLLFLHPALRTLPELLQIELHGKHHPHIEAYWEGLAYVV